MSARKGQPIDPDIFMNVDQSRMNIFLQKKNI